MPSTLSPPIFNSIAAILADQFHVAADVITPDTALSDLGLDSLGLMEFVFAVEDAFHLRLPEDRLDPREAGITLQRLCEAVDTQIRCEVEAPLAAAA